jgi:hypothetical protein
MDPRVRALTKDIAKDVSASLTSASEKTTEEELLAMIVVAGLARLEAIAGENDELLRVAQRSRKAVQRFEPAQVEHNTKVEESGLNLGPYSHTKVFDGKEQKANKFARLMGGAKEGPHTSPRLHPTYAPSHDQEREIEKNIEKQYQDAAQHKGKKGLGT